MLRFRIANAQPNLWKWYTCFKFSSINAFQKESRKQLTWFCVVGFYAISRTFPTNLILNEFYHMNVPSHDWSELVYK